MLSEKLITYLSIVNETKSTNQFCTEWFILIKKRFYLFDFASRFTTDSTIYFT